MAGGKPKFAQINRG